MADELAGCVTILGFVMFVGWAGYCMTDCHFAEPVMGSYAYLDTTSMHDSDGGTVFFDGRKFTSGHRCAMTDYLTKTPTECIGVDGVTVVTRSENARLQYVHQWPDSYLQVCCTSVVPGSDKELLASVRREVAPIYEMGCLKRGVILIGTFTTLALVVLAVIGAVIAFVAGRASPPEEQPSTGAVPEVP